MRAKTTIGCCLVLLAVSLSTADDRPSTPENWLTLAERSDFERTPSYEETLAFIRRLAAHWPSIRLEFYGESAQGRPMPVVIVSKESGLAPGGSSNRARVLIQNGIHSGEIDGKDASLMILRDMALGRHRELLEQVDLLVVPIYNVDGHERVSIYNRPNQNGPVAGMGFRTTADGHDLNRDHLKLDTPEARNVIRLFNAWKPHLHVDNHVTNGVDHDWVLTYSWVEAPQASTPLGSWLSGQMPAVLQATEAAGHRVGPYVSLIDRNDPSKGIDTSVQQPRYATGYYPLRNCPSILVENHSYKPYRDRVLANHDFMLALLRRIAADPAALIRAVDESGERTAALGRPDAEPSQVVLRYKRAETNDKVSLPIYEWRLESSTVLGAPLLKYESGRVQETEVPWYHRTEPEISVARPRGYLVVPGWPVIDRRIEDHGLRFRRLKEAVDLDVETLRISNPRQGPRSRPSYQGRTRIGVDVERRIEKRRLPAGTLWIPADQPDFEVAVQLLEPEAPDSLLSWGMLSSVLEWKEYIDSRNLEKIAAEMLEDDEVAQEWQRALEDESFAGDPTARYTWWYQRTKYWDETVGLMPVMRLMTPPTFDATAADVDASIEGVWRAWLDSPGGPLPFGLEFERRADGLAAWLINDPERIEVEDVEFADGRVVVSITHYDASIIATLDDEGRAMEGRWRKTAAGRGKESSLPFHATRGMRPRFDGEPEQGGDAHERLSGRWAIDFEKDELAAVALLEAAADGTVTGTFMTATGDYRFLAGNFVGDRLRLSVFDGAHAFLFDARMGEDGTLAGDFWSRESWHERWTARRDPDARLPDAFAQTRWLDGADLGRAVFPDLEGVPRALDDPAFDGRARLLVIFGSWCPNCNDLSGYLVELDRRYRERGLSILGLAFEMTGDFERDAAQVRTYAEHHGIEYPLLVAGLSDKARATEAFPLIDRVRSFPTTIFIGGDGKVRAVHSGFTGPATGAAHDELRSRFETLIEELLAAGGASIRVDPAGI